MNKRSISQTIAALVLGWLLCNYAAPAQPAKTEAAAPVELVLEHRSLGKAAAVWLQVGEKSYPFLFDTAGGITTVSPDVAREIGCRPFGRMSKMEPTGKRLNLPRCDGVKLKAGDFTAEVDAGVFNVMSFFGPQTPPVGGIVTLQTFENRALTIDLAGNRIWLETDASLAERVRAMSPLETKINRQFGGKGLEVLIAAATPGGKIWMLFDSGNFGALQFAPHAQEMLGISFETPNKAKTSKPVKFDLINLGPLEMPGREREMIIDGMLNYDTIRRMTVTIDTRDGRMWARLNPPAPAK